METQSLLPRIIYPKRMAARLTTACATRLLPLPLLLALPAVVQAQFIYTANNGALTITGYTGAGGSVSIPRTFNGLPVTSIGNDAFASCTGLTSVTIPNSVTSMGDYAFLDCASLTSVCFQGDAPSVGSGVFDGDSHATIYYLAGTTGWGATYGGRPTVVQYTVATGSFPATGGSASGGGSFTAGSSVNALAAPNPGYAFVNWTENGVQVSTSASYTFTLTASRTLTANFVMKPTDAITVSASPSGGGRVSGGGTFKAGSSRTVTAAPNAGYVFANWTENGGVVSGSASCTFTLRSDRNLVANFIPNPFPAVSGTYNGLFADEANGITPASCGCFTITVTAKGTYTGSLQVGGGRYSLTGQFDATGSANETMARRNLSALTVALQLDLANGTDRVTGSVSGGTWTATLAGDRAIYDGKTKIAPGAGSYTLILAGPHGSATEPGGDSYGTLTVGKNGEIAFAGTLADGTKVTPSAPVSKHGQWPLYASLYSGQGVLWGWLAFTTPPGTVAWVKLPENTAYYPTGFSLAAEAVGARYSPPGKGTNVLGMSTTKDLTLTLEDGGLMQGITNRLGLTPNGQVTPLSGSKLSLTFTPATGAFNGSVVNPATGKPISFGGVVLQGQGIGSGFFLGTSGSGEVRLEP